MDTPNPSSPTSLSQQAIKAALDSRWEDALNFNFLIIEDDPVNVDALNRIAKANMELSNWDEAKKYYNLALEVDPYNPIASKNIKIISSFKDNGKGGVPNNHNGHKLSPSLFLQEPGKTKVVNLLKIAEPQKLSHLFCGMPVNMVLKNRKIIVVDENDGYLGVLPDDVSHFLVRLMRGGNKYEAFIKSIKVNALAILIRETVRSKRFKNQPSFLDTHSTVSQTSDMITSLDNDDDDSEEVMEDEEPSV